MEMIKGDGYYPGNKTMGRYSSGNKAVYKAHILHALMDLGYTDHLRRPVPGAIRQGEPAASL